MTPTEATALIQQIVDDCADRQGELMNVERGIALLAQALQAERRAVWLEVERRVRYRNDDPAIYRENWERFADDCRTQAEDDGTILTVNQRFLTTPQGGLR